MTYVVRTAPLTAILCFSSPLTLAHPSSPASTRGMVHSSALRMQPKCTMLYTHLYCIPGTLPLKEIGKLNLNRREPNTVRERHIMHVHVCSSVNKELSVCIHTPMWCVCACTHTCYGRHYMHGTALQTQYVPEVPLRLLNNTLKANESNSIYVQTLFMIRCKTSSESPSCAMSSTESG